MRGALPALLLVALLPVARAEAEATGVLPVGGDQRLAARLNPALGRAVAGKGQPQVLGPVEVQARVAAEPELAATLERAREAIALSREQELRMNRGAAVAAAQSAISTAQAIRGPLLAPELLISAHTSLALASLLRPDDPEAASRALREALALDPAYRPAPGQLSARALRLLDEARPAARPLRPTARELGWVAGRLRLARLLWVGLVSRPGARVRVEVMLYDAAVGRVRTRLEAESAEAQLLEHRRPGRARARGTEREPAPRRRRVASPLVSTLVGLDRGGGRGGGRRGRDRARREPPPRGRGGSTASTSTSDPPLERYRHGRSGARSR
jgi:hypothetical protein